ncbi:TPA: hypothetical protein ACIQN7_002718 [Bacillus cereus]
MPILSPRALGPISECSRSVAFENALPGAKVILVRIRVNIEEEIGSVIANQSQGVIVLSDPNEELITGDFVYVYQRTTAEDSIVNYGQSIKVQKGIDLSTPPQVPPHLYQCSRGFLLGAIGAGTKVEILKGSQIIGTGEGINGIAYIQINSNGLPLAGTILKIRQRVCHKPPPPNNPIEYIIDHDLPPIEPLPGFPEQIELPFSLPAPTITAGLTDCSRAIEVSNILPGAEVFLRDSGGLWWAWIGASDRKTIWLPLPTSLVKDRKIEVHQEVSTRCANNFERNYYTVGPQVTLPKPELGNINCDTPSTLNVKFLKLEANVEIKVLYPNGHEISYFTTASKDKEEKEDNNFTIPSPPLAQNAAVSVRQGECNHWSEWSAPQTVNTLTTPPLQPIIPGDLFHCQNTILVESLVPTGGTVKLFSNKREGEFKSIEAHEETVMISVAPSLQKDEVIYAEYHLCNFRVTSETRQVKALNGPNAGYIDGPIFDGDTIVKVNGITAGAYIELWDGTDKKFLASGSAPINGNSTVTIILSGFGTLIANHRIYTKYWHCGKYGENDGLFVQITPPLIQRIEPPFLLTDGSNGPFYLRIFGLNFRPGAVLQWNGQNQTTTFVSSEELGVMISVNMQNTPQTGNIQVLNNDGKVSNIKQFDIKSPTLPLTHVPILTLSWHNDNSVPSKKSLNISVQGFKANEKVVLYINHKRYPHSINDADIENDIDTMKIGGEKANNIGGYSKKFGTLILPERIIYTVKVIGALSGASSVSSVLVPGTV